MLPIEPANDGPLAEIVEYKDDSSDMEVDITGSFAETPSTQPSFVESSSTWPSLAESSFAGLPIAHSSMADTFDSSMPSFDTSDVSSLLDDTNLASFQVPNISAENSIDDSLPVAAVPAELSPIEYCIIPGGTKHGNDMLTDSHGFSYTRKPPKRGASSDTVYWRCAVCNKDVQCPAKVIQDGNSFTRGRSNHLDSAQPGIANTVRIKKKVKSVALSDIFTSAAEITDKVLAENVTQEPSPALPAPINLAKAANRHRQCFHPKDPVHLDFDLAEDFIPEGFFCKDIVVGDRCHLLFATDKMLQLLSIAKNWFIDATFKVVKHPFTQLLSIHSFIKSGDTKKQIPLLFALMSGKCKRDYKKVFKAAINII